MSYSNQKSERDRAECYRRVTDVIKKTHASYLKKFPSREEGTIDFSLETTRQILNVLEDYQFTRIRGHKP